MDDICAKEKRKETMLGLAQPVKTDCPSIHVNQWSVELTDTESEIFKTILVLIVYKNSSLTSTHDLTRVNITNLFNLNIMQEYRVVRKNSTSDESWTCVSPKLWTRATTTPPSSPLCYCSFFDISSRSCQQLTANKAVKIMNSNTFSRLFQTSLKIYNLINFFHAFSRYFVAPIQY